MSWRAQRAAALLACLALTAAGCALAPSPAAQPTPRERLEAAESRLAEADLEAAAVELLALVDEHPSSPEAPRALFQLAAVYLAPSSPLHEMSRGVTLLEELVDAYPSSPWRLPSDAILELTGTNADLRRLAAELQAQLDRLKQIDIGADG